MLSGIPEVMLLSPGRGMLLDISLLPKQSLIRFSKPYSTVINNRLIEVKQMNMNVSEQRTFNANATCPNLNEWAESGSSFCRLRFMVPDILTNSEIREYCKNDNHCRCVFYLKQVDTVSKTYSS
jgi:hypothetical protein